MYVWLKTLHISCVILTLSGLILRGWWRWQQSPWLSSHWVRVFPHAIDTLLLSSGLLMLWLLQIHPGNTPWLAAKLIGLLLYIVLGGVALKRGKTPRIRLGSGLAALVVAAYMIKLALTKSVW